VARKPVHSQAGPQSLIERREIEVLESGILYLNKETEPFARGSNTAPYEHRSDLALTTMRSERVEPPVQQEFSDHKATCGVLLEPGHPSGPSRRTGVLT
jgi:hypothetical protein